MNARFALGMVALALALLMLRQGLVVERRSPPCDPGYTPTTWPSGAVTCLAHEGPRGFVGLRAFAKD